MALSQHRARSYSNETPNRHTLAAAPLAAQAREPSMSPASILEIRRRGNGRFAQYVLPAAESPQRIITERLQIDVSLPLAVLFGGERTVLRPSDCTLKVSHLAVHVIPARVSVLQIAT